jgi:phosphonate transport system substrate-binding protein
VTVRGLLSLGASGLLLAAVGCGPAAESVPANGPTAAPDATGVLTFGSVSLSPAQEYGLFRPFASYVASKLGGVGIGRGRVVVVDSISQMVDELEAGRVDVYIDSPFPVAFVRQHADVQLPLRRWKWGSDSYRSIVFTRADSGITTLDELSGHVVAFGEPFSTSGFLMPKAALASAGLKLVNYADPAASIPANRVGYMFSNDAENTMFWVLKGKVFAGAVNADYYKPLAGSRINELRVLHTTEPVPRNVVCFRSGLGGDLIQAVERVLLAMHLTAEGRRILDDFEGTTKFDRFPNGAEQDLASIMGLLPYVEEDLGL